MTSRIILGVALAAGLALPFGAAPALAQTTAPAGTQAPATATNPSAEVEAHIDALRSELKITQAELPQWNAFAAVMRENAASMEQLYRQRSEQEATMNAVQILESYRAFARAHVRDLNRLVPAFKKLYASLSPEQQKTADAIFAAHAARAPGRAG